MALSQNLIQKQTQKLIITQDLRQSIELLPLSNIELSERIQKELVENPMLEEAGESDSYSAVNDEINQKERKNRETGATEDQGESWKESHGDQTENGFQTSGEGRDRSEKKHQFLQNAVSSQETLQDHLLWQLKMTDLSEEELEAGELIISDIDSHGFLTENLESLIQDTGISPEIAQKALSRIYELDPVGCGARDVQESLYIQARLLQPDYEIAHRLLEKHFEEIEKLDYRKIEKATSYTLTEIESAIQFIRSLEPFPGTMYAPAQPEYILPDLVIVDAGGSPEIVINDEWIPSLRINDDYRQILKEGRIGNELDREYLQTRLNSAQWLIKSISQRRHTLLRVMQAILEFQAEFFKKGHGYLKPLTLKDVAEKLELHESTVSRITTNKYVQTRWGIFELKYFFSSSLKSVGGGDGQSARNIQDRVKKIIDEEDPNHPLSDQEIVEIIRKEGVEIARRTVAKYRKILKILPADRRKKLKGLNSGG